MRRRPGSALDLADRAADLAAARELLASSSEEEESTPAQHVDDDIQRVLNALVLKRPAAVRVTHTYTVSVVLVMAVFLYVVLYLIV